MSRKSNYKPEIEGLRALAVIAVIINHFNKALLPSGYLGVDIFFVISGFVICSSLLQTSTIGLIDLLTTFYVRRIKRLVPALLFCVFASSVITSLLLTSPDLSLRTAAASVFGVSNLYLLRRATDYFSASAETNIFLHTWSLGVEEQFYLLFPILFWLGRSFVNRNRSVFVLTGIFSALSLSGFIYLYTFDQPAAYFLMPARFWELGAGCLLSLRFERCQQLFYRIKYMNASLVLLAMVLFLFAPTSYAVIATIVVVTLTVLFTASVRTGDLSFVILSHPLSQFIGALSYSLYLWHWVVISLSRWTVGVYWWTAPFQLMLILLLAIISYQFIENPLRHAVWSSVRLRTVIYGFVCSSSVAALILILAFPLKAQFAEAARHINPPHYADLEIMQGSLPCHLPKKVDTAFKDCLLPSNSVSSNIYIIGDSHASNHFPSVREVVRNYSNWGVTYLIDWGFIHDLEGNKKCDTGWNCIDNSFDKHVRFLSDNLKPGDLVIFSWARDRVVKGDRFPRESEEVALQILKSKLNIIKVTVKSKSAILILVDDIPKPCDPSVVFETEIIQRGNLSVCIQEIGVSRADRQGLTNLYKFLAEPRVLYFDPHDSLCYQGSCSLTLGSQPGLIYADASPHFPASKPTPLYNFWKTNLRDILENRVIP
jgi:peptidoglycan/LPS O-acetylase OafA/YrhL